MKRINIKLEDESHTQAKVIAVLLDKTLNDFIEEAVVEAIKKNKDILKKIKNIN